MRIAALRESLGASSERAELEIVARTGRGNVHALPMLAKELVEAHVDVIVAASPAAVRAAREVTAAIPIIAVDLETDPVASGLVASLARPGGNVTGVFLDLAEVSAKCLQLLVECTPGLPNVAVLWDPATGPYQLRAVEVAASALGVALLFNEISDLNDVEAALRLRGRERHRGMLLLSSPLIGGNAKFVAEMALTNGVPGVTLFPEFAQEGGMLAYGPDLQLLFRQAAMMVRKVLQDVNAAELPVERPTHFRLIVNLKTASAFGISVPPAVLVRADEVIE
jgi:putative ABC transport system substrate-binding protein